MPRTARAIVSGLYYHVINRGNNRATVFSEPREFDSFVDLMRRAQARHHIDVAAVCLMPNHFHLLVRPAAAADLASWFHWMLTTHASWHHKKCNSSGRIWTSRFKAFPIQDYRHLLTVARYVERNALPANWSDVVNAPQTAIELTDLRRCVNWGSPYGDLAFGASSVDELAK